VLSAARRPPTVDHDEANELIGDVLWGTITVEHEAGSWSGTLVGTTDLSGAGRGITYLERVGAGAYEGLSAVIFRRELASSEVTWNGVIFDGPLPPDR
jgi:hypothetical protein